MVAKRKGAGWQPVPFPHKHASEGGDVTILAPCQGCSKVETPNGQLCKVCEVAGEHLDLRESVQAEPTEFPLYALPDPCANFVQTTAKAGGFPLSYCAASVFPVAATALGERRLLVVDADSDWTEPPVLFVPLVGPTGQAKSPVMNIMTQPLVHLDDDAHALYEVELDNWQKTDDKEKKSLSLRYPRMRPWIRTDVTMERLSIDLLHKRSILAWYDELTEWARSMTGNRYGNNATINRSKWLSLWGGKRFDRVRVGTDREDVDIHIPNPRVSLLGGIQPMLLGELFQAADGMEQRMLFAVSDVPRPPKRVGKIEDREWWNAAIRRLAMLDTRDVMLRPEALELSEVFREEMYARRWSSEAIPKIVTHCHRLALIVGHLWMYYEGNDGRDLYARDMENAIAISRWFYSQWESLEPQLSVGAAQERLTLLGLEKLKDYLLRKRNDQGIVLWRVVLQAKKPGCHTTELLKQAMNTLEAMDFAKETTWKGQRAIQVKSPTNRFTA